MARSYSNIAVQIGVETTAGTEVAANKRLMGLRLDPQAAVETQQHRPSGYKVPTVSSVVTEMTEADFEGPIDYKNIIYPLSSLFGKATTTQPDATKAPNVYEHVWTFTGKGAITPQTYSIEVGDQARASKFTYAVFNSMELSIERTGENTMSGSVIGRALQTGKTLTPNATEVTIVPVNGDHWDVFADPAHGDLGKTQLMNIYNAGLSFSDMFAQEFTLNSANRSFASLYDAEEPSLEWSMTVKADAVAEAYFDKVRNGGKTFLRLKATGPTIADTHRYGIEIDLCAVVTEFDAYESQDGNYVLPITFSLAYDAAWGKAMVIRVTNDVAAL